MDNKLKPGRQVIEMVPARESFEWAKLSAAAMRYSVRAFSALIIVVVGLIVVRVGIAIWLRNEFAISAADLARVSGIDAGLAHWMQSTVAWMAGLVLFSLVGRLILPLVWPFASLKGVWKPAMLLVIATGFGAAAPLVVQSIRHVDSTGQPDRMQENTTPGSMDWFTPNGQAKLYYSRETNGILRFWNRLGKTPDHALPSIPVTPEIRLEWERIETQRATQEKQRLLEAQQKRLSTEIAVQPESKWQAVQKQSGEAPQHAEAKRFNALESKETENETGTIQQLSQNKNYDVVFRLFPSELLHFRVNGRPCTVWGDVAFEVFPNNPTHAHKFVRSGDRLHFPILNGVGPTSLHARSLSSSGLIYVRFDPR